MRFEIHTEDMPTNGLNIINMLENFGHEAYFVGGCVRDCCLNILPDDWDICTSATPDQVIDIFSSYYGVVETGIKHGTVTVVINPDDKYDGIQESYEVTTYRIDGEYSDSRHPDNVEFADDIVKDLSRRDFTINAMAFSPQRGFIDPFNGTQDLISKIIRCVGRPEDRFSEDPLRMMRAIRFAAKLGFSLEPSVIKGIYLSHPLLSNISMERKRDELSEILLCKDYERFAYRGFYKKILFQLIPELEQCDGFNQNNPHHRYKDLYVHITKAVVAADPVLGIEVRLALLLHDIAKPQCYSEDEGGIGHFYKHASVGESITKDILRRMKYDNKTIEVVSQLVHYHDGTIKESSKSVKRWLNKLGHDQMIRLVCVKNADRSAHNNSKASGLNSSDLSLISYINKIFYDKDECFSLRTLAINGNDLISIGYRQGKDIGRMLECLLSKVIDGSIENDKVALLEYASKTRDEKIHLLGIVIEKE